MAKPTGGLAAKLNRIAREQINVLVDLWQRAEGNMNKLTNWIRFKYGLTSNDVARDLISRASTFGATWLGKMRATPDAPVPWAQIPPDANMPWYRHRGSEFVYRVVVKQGDQFGTIWVRSKSELSYSQLESRTFANMQEAAGNSPRLALMLAESDCFSCDIREITPARRPQ